MDALAVQLDQLQVRVHGNERRVFLARHFLGGCIRGGLGGDLRVERGEVAADGAGLGVEDALTASGLEGALAGDLEYVKVTYLLIQILDDENEKGFFDFVTECSGFGSRS